MASLAGPAGPAAGVFRPALTESELNSTIETMCTILDESFKEVHKLARFLSEPITKIKQKFELDDNQEPAKDVVEDYCYNMVEPAEQLIRRINRLLNEKEQGITAWLASIDPGELAAASKTFLDWANTHREEDYLISRPKGNICILDMMETITEELRLMHLRWESFEVEDVAVRVRIGFKLLRSLRRTILAGLIEGVDKVSKKRTDKAGIDAFWNYRNPHGLARNYFPDVQGG